RPVEQLMSIPGPYRHRPTRVGNQHLSPLIRNGPYVHVVDPGLCVGIGQPPGDTAAKGWADVLRSNCGSPACSWPGLLSTGTVRMRPPAVTSEKTSHLPSGLKEVGICMFLLFVRDCDSPAPSARFQKIPPAASKTTNCPSGLHTGHALTLPLVKRIFP